MSHLPRVRSLEHEVLKLQRERIEIDLKYGVALNRIKPLEQALRGLVTAPVVRQRIKQIGDDAYREKKPDPYTAALRALGYSAEGTHDCHRARYNPKFCGECGKRME